MDARRNIETARKWAAKMAEQAALGRATTEVDRMLKKGGAYKELKEQIKMARKPRMRTVEQFVCDGCDGIIQNEEDGFVIKGNIYTANPNHPGGLIGDNFPKVKEGEKVDPSAVMQNVMCRTCLMKALGLQGGVGRTPVAKRSVTASKSVSSKVANELESILKG